MTLSIFFHTFPTHLSTFLPILISAMVLPGDLESGFQEWTPPLSPEQIEHCKFKNAEVNRSLSLSPEQDPSEHEVVDFDVP